MVALMLACEESAAGTATGCCQCHHDLKMVFNYSNNMDDSQNHCVKSLWTHCEIISQNLFCLSEEQQRLKTRTQSQSWAGVCAAESVFTCHEETSRVEFWKSQVSRRAKWAQLRAKYWSTNSIPPTELVTLTQDLTSDSGRWPGHNGLNLHRIRQRRV